MNFLTHVDAEFCSFQTCPRRDAADPLGFKPPGTQEAFREACAHLCVLELGDEFAMLDGGQAESELLKKVQERLH